MFKKFILNTVNTSYQKLKAYYRLNVNTILWLNKVI